MKHEITSIDQVCNARSEKPKKIKLTHITKSVTDNRMKHEITLTDLRIEIP